MFSRSLLATSALAAVLTVVPLAAQAACQRPAELIDKTTFDSTPDATASSFHISNATAGELGGYLDVLVVAKDGSLPTGSEVCEPAIVTTVLTVSPGEVLSSRVKGQLCTDFYGLSMNVNAAVHTVDLHYTGTAHRTPKVVGDGLVAANFGALLGGGLASFSASVRW